MIHKDLWISSKQLENWSFRNRLMLFPEKMMNFSSYTRVQREGILFIDGFKKIDQNFKTKRNTM